MLIDGLKPVLVAVEADHAKVELALRPHWLHGPHVLVGIGGSPSVRDGSAKQIELSMRDWLSRERPGPAIDETDYHHRSLSLAKAEGSPYKREPLRADLTVERGEFAQPLPHGDPQLGSLRDAFRSASLWTALDIVEKRRISLTASLIAYAGLFIALEHLNWHDSLNPWPLSPQGQVEASGALAETANFGAALHELEDLLLKDISSNQRFDKVVSHNDRFTVSILQNAYDMVLSFGQGNEKRVRTWAQEEIGIYKPPNGLTAEQWFTVLASPRHFAYRFLMNHIYDMQPLVGFTSVHRLLVCHALVSVLKKEYPQTIRRAQEAGSHF